MKRLIALIIVCCILPAIVLADLSPYYAIYNPMESLVYNEKYDEFISSISELQKEHPLLMSDSWLEILTSKATEAMNAIPQMENEYDPFDDFTYYWFGDHRKANENDNCVIVDDQTGSVLSFFFPVDDHIGIEKYAAVYNGSERFEGFVYDHVFDNLGSMLYESFTVDTADVPDEVSTLSFRFYGENKQIDYQLDQEEIEQLNSFVRRYSAKESLKSALKTWKDEIDLIVDVSYIPYGYGKAIDEGAKMYPATMTNEDLWKFEQMPSAVSVPEKWNGIYIGSSFCISNNLSSIHKPGLLFSCDCWECGYGNHAYFVMISDHAKAMGWDKPDPKEGDALIVGVTFAGVNSFYNRPVFYLGFDDETVSLAKKGVPK